MQKSPEEPESTEHALLLCPWTRVAWFGAQIQCCPTVHTVSSFGKWIMDLLKNMKVCTGTDYEQCSSKVGFLAWEVWKARNQVVHQRSKPSPIIVIYKAKQMEIEFTEMAEELAKSFVNERRKVRRVTWRPSLPGWVKCNVDAVFVEVFSGGATTAVFRDHHENLLTASNSKIVATSPLVAEALAVRKALIIAKNFQLERIIFESDSLILIQALKSKASIAEIQVILDDILDLARNISNCGFTWVPREGNGLAHEVAKLTVDSSLQQNWLMCKPQNHHEHLEKRDLHVTANDKQIMREGTVPFERAREGMTDSWHFEDWVLELSLFRVGLPRSTKGVRIQKERCSRCGSATVIATATYGGCNLSCWAMEGGDRDLLAAASKGKAASKAMLRRKRLNEGRLDTATPMGAHRVLAGEDEDFRCQARCSFIQALGIC
ncbi:hypothetical protein Ahy_A07g033241 [Arachis hypogaea]|uniref:RNase H type-1 domain-containing protein n=1 Tax=Arachis hypogaea TaxID=3818 RepID=A0A445C8X1_ARAHY|nr:hypothetical protein Ahy_A07g033241 [Arachis hypogaea]